MNTASRLFNRAPRGWALRLWLLVLSCPGLLHGVDNPFLRVDSVNDCGVLKYNGEYYITGNWLAGQMYSSRNLTDWGNRTKVITHVGGWAPTHPYDDLSIHASQPVYADGLFHLYFQVDDKIGHAVSTNVLGMYTETVTNVPLASNIDAEFFRDDNGSNYLYSVKFLGGNVIYGQRMKDPGAMSGSASQLLTALPGTWEKLGTPSINEGPCVFKHRGRYYMLYNANDTGSTNYQIGCAESGSPLGFSNAGKHSQPVLARTASGGGEIRTLGQPWVVEGPNGFEKWLGYFAIYSPEGEGRYQCVDRVRFHDKTLVVDGPTSRFTTGYHPEPAKPSLLALFNIPDGPLPASDWGSEGGGSWAVLNRRAVQTDTSGFFRRTVNRDPALHYLIEGNLEFSSDPAEEGKAGILAHFADEQNWMAVGIDRNAGKWFATRLEQGVLTTVGGALWAGWKHDAFHKIRVERNARRFEIRIDGMVPGGAATPIVTTFASPGCPGIFTDHTAAFFDGIIHTVGWDEFDSGVGGWDAAEGDSVGGANWDYVTNGVVQQTGTGDHRVFKGDLMAEYEVSTQVYRVDSVPTDGDRHTMGFVPVMIDARNYLRAEIDMARHTLVVETVLEGVAGSAESQPFASAASYNLRAAKLQDRVILFVDGVETMTVTNSFGPSRVGLSNRNLAARYNGIQVYRTEQHRPASPWKGTDIGTVGFTGNADSFEGTMVVNASGADIWDRRDAGHFVYQRLSGNGQIVARLDSVDPVNFWTKAGLMFRESLVDNGRMVFLQANAGSDGNGTQHSLDWRDTPGAGTGSLPHSKTPLLPSQSWMRLARQGNTFTGYYSTNGVLWTQIGSCQVAMPANSYIGIAVTSHDNSRSAGAVFDNISIRPGPSYTSLEAGADRIAYGNPLVLTAVVSTSGGTPSGSVTFLDGTTILGTSAVDVGSSDSATATLAVGNLSAGAHLVSAKYGGGAAHVASTSTNLNILVLPRQLAIQGIRPDSKVYDGTMAATLRGTPELSGVVSGDDVGLGGSPTGSFDDPNVGVGKPVRVTGYTLQGTKAANYALPESANMTADITARTLTITVRPVTRRYGSANPTFMAEIVGLVSGETLPGTVSGVPVLSATAGPRSAPGSYAVSASGLTLNSANYHLEEAAGNQTALTITRLPLVVAGSRTFDGTILAPAETFRIENLVAGDDLILRGTAALASANTGTASVDVGAFLLTGASASNYTLEGAEARYTVIAVDTQTLVTAFPQAAQPGSNVVFVATVLGVPSVPTVPPGTLSFRIGNSAALAVAMDKNGQAVWATSLSAHGTNMIHAAYEGTVNFRPSEGHVAVLVNRNPESRFVSLRAIAGTNTTLSLLTGPDPAVDADGDSVRLLWVLPPSHGSVATEPDSLVYSPAPGYLGEDSFQYALVDPFGGVGIGTVAVDVIARPDDPEFSVTVELSAATLRITWPGLPGRQYVVQGTPSLLDPRWTTLGQLPGTGELLSFEQETSGSSAMFFRVLRAR